MFNLDDYVVAYGVRKYTSVGCYPLYYVTADGSVLSPEAVEDNLALCRDPDDRQWFVVAADANWEDPALYCDHTGERIESAYADDDCAECEDDNDND